MKKVSAEYYEQKEGNPKVLAHEQLSKFEAIAHIVNNDGDTVWRWRKKGRTVDVADTQFKTLEDFKVAVKAKKIKFLSSTPKTTNVAKVEKQVQEVLSRQNAPKPPQLTASVSSVRNAMLAMRNAS